MSNAADVSVRTEPRPGDLGAITRLHGALYAQEYGWDITFEAYVAGTLAQFGNTYDARKDRIWLAELNDELVGCVGILGGDNGMAQLRWFLVHPKVRGIGLGKSLMTRALAFCRATDRTRVFLWTVSALTAAAHLYRAAGFELVERRPGPGWSSPVIEERYELALNGSEA